MMNKNSIKLALLLLLGIGFQAQAMKKQTKQEKLNEELFDALYNLDSIKNDVQKVKKSLLDGADVNASTKYGQSPLYLAIENCSDCPKMVQILIDNGANVNEKKKSSYSSLYLACFNFESFLEKFQNEYLILIKLLLSNNASCFPVHNFIQSNNELHDIFINVDQVDQLKNSPNALAQKLIDLDEKYLLQRVLIDTKSSKELKLFAKALQNEAEKNFKIFLNDQDFQESLIEQYATPAIMYRLMIKDIVPITEKLIMAQPAKKRQLELQYRFDQNKMITFNENFDTKLNYNNNK